MALWQRRAEGREPRSPRAPPSPHVRPRAHAHTKTTRARGSRRGWGPTAGESRAEPGQGAPPGAPAAGEARCCAPPAPPNSPSKPRNFPMRCEEVYKPFHYLPQCRCVGPRCGASRRASSAPRAASRRGGFQMSLCCTQMLVTMHLGWRFERKPKNHSAGFARAPRARAASQRAAVQINPRGSLLTVIMDVRVTLLTALCGT